MVALPILSKLAYNFLAKSSAEIHQDFAMSAYLFLCSIFVAMTNQVKFDFFYCIIFIHIYIVFILVVNIFINFDKIKLNYGAGYLYILIQLYIINRQCFDNGCIVFLFRLLVLVVMVKLIKLSGHFTTKSFAQTKTPICHKSGN